MTHGSCPHQFDKSRWPRGPWDQEPDRVDFEAHGFPCILHRGPIGSWCGYVGVPKGHPWYEKSTTKLEVAVHGGLTYSDACRGCICHVPKEDPPIPRWWIGFDCAHYGDITPLLDIAPRFNSSFAPNAFYRTVHYAKTQTQELAEQAKEADRAAQHPTERLLGGR